MTRLLCLAKSSDHLVQRRVTELLRNYSLTAEGRQVIVGSSEFPSLSHLLTSPDANCRSSSVAFIKNIVEDKTLRVKLLQAEPKLISALVNLLRSSDSNIQQCSAGCLESLAEEKTFGLEIIEVQGLAAL
ncbi:hypothetical protein EC968_009982, partial [Mortierella alpina]